MGKYAGKCVEVVCDMGKHRTYTVYIDGNAFGSIVFINSLGMGWIAVESAYLQASLNAATIAHLMQGIVQPRDLTEDDRKFLIEHEACDDIVTALFKEPTNV